MKARGVFETFNPGEDDVRGFDFIDDLAPGDSIDATTPAVWTCTDAAGVDPSPQARLEGNPTFDGTKTLQFVGQPVPGASYVLAARIRTTLGATLVLWGFNPCRAIGQTGA